MLVYFEFCFIFVQSLCRGNIDFFQNSAFPCAELCRVLGNSWCCWIFENFQSLLNQGKFGQGFALFLKFWVFVCDFWKFQNFGNILSVDFWEKLARAPPYTGVFGFLKFSKCGFLRKFDQGSALFLKFWGFVRDFWKCLKFLKFLSVEF